MRLSALAQYVDTDVVRLVQDCEADSAELCAAVKGPDAVTYLEKEKFLPFMEQEGIAAVICTEELVDKLPAHIRGVLVSDSPKYAFYCVHNALAELTPALRVPSRISESAEIDPSAVISPWNVEIGDGVSIEAGAVIGEYVTIGSCSRICSMAVVGARSFNPARYKDRTVTLEDCGRVEIGNRVLICSQSAVVRGVLSGEVTRIGDDAKIDTFVHTAHGVYIGERAFVASGAILGGNCWIGRNAWVGINATVSNRIKIGDGARVSLGSVVTKNVPAGTTVTDNFAVEHRQFLQNLKLSLTENTTGGQLPPQGQPETPIWHNTLRDLRKEAA